jgi:hypothetical protein
MPSAPGCHDDHLVFIRGRAVGLDDLRRLGRQAFLLHEDGRLYVYDQGAFWFSQLNAENPRGREVDDEACLPAQTWYHYRSCDCDACRPAGTRSEDG